MKFEVDKFNLDELLRDQKIVSSALFPKLAVLNKKRAGINTVMHLIDREKRDMMKQIRDNFKFIGGFTNKMQIRDLKGILTNKEWRVDQNVYNKIIRPTSTLTSCARKVEDLGKSN